MSAIGILGAGAGGLAAAVELTLAGHDVRLWNRRAATIAPYADRSIVYRGVLGAGSVRVAVVTVDLAVALDGADVVVVCLPALAHEAVFGDLARVGCETPIVLNPGHTGGALHARAILGAAGALPPVAELSTLTYVARKAPDGSVDVSGRAGTVRCGALPGAKEATQWAHELFPSAADVPDVLASSLSNVNLVLHPPGAILGAAWVEATGGDFRFYVDAMTPAVFSVLERLDAERLEVASRFGHELPPLVKEMAAIGTADSAAADGDGLLAIRSGTANRNIKGPDSLSHRYYQEDFPFGVVPFLALADAAGVPAPVTRALLCVGSAAAGRDFAACGLGAAGLGIEGCSLPDILTRVRC